MENLKELETLTKEDWRKLDYKEANKILAPMPLLERLELLQNTPTSMLPYDHWLKTSKAELMRWYMNALTTCSCLGHNKGARNEALVKKYKELMEKYKIPVPPNEISYVLGVFNGDGSS